MIQSLTRPDQSVTGYSYDSLKRLTQISNKKSNQDIINQYNYSFNHPDFQLDQRSDEIVSGVTIFKPLQNETLSYDTNNLNQLTQITPNPQPPTPSTLAYDANGNLTKGYTPQGYEFTAAYDAENRLKSLEYTDNQGKIHTTLNTYRADFFLVKLEKFENHVKMAEVNFIGEGFLPIQERTTVAGQPSSVKSYIWGQNMGGGIGGLLNMHYQGQDYSYLYDGKGNVTAVLDSSQNTVATYTYDEFGKVVSKTGTLDQPFQFSTKYYDQQTGLNYYGYRFYSPALGRWINRDPIGEEGGVNLYGFVENNPVNAVDPYGEAISLPLYVIVVLVALAAAASYYSWRNAIDHPITWSPAPTIPKDTTKDKAKPVPIPIPIPIPFDIHEHCRELYLQCGRECWTGDCSTCFHYCITQGEWDFLNCHPCR